MLGSEVRTAMEDNSCQHAARTVDGELHLQHLLAPPFTLIASRSYVDI